MVKGIDEIWAADLVEMQQFSKWNKGYKYLLMVIDVFSKYGWIAPLKNKKGETVAEAFESIFKKGNRRQPKMLWTDKGSEFYNKHMKDLLAVYNINCTVGARWLVKGAGFLKTQHTLFQHTHTFPRWLPRAQPHNALRLTGHYIPSFPL